MTDDLVFDLPYGPDFIPNPIDGLEPWNADAADDVRDVHLVRADLDEVHACLDPDELIAEYRSEAVVAAQRQRRTATATSAWSASATARSAHWNEFHNPDATKVMR